MNDYRIRRDHSSLSDGTLFGQKQRSRLRRWHIGLWLLALAALGYVFFQRSTIQPVVLKVVFGIAPTPTPTGLEYATRADHAFLRGDLDTAIDNYREAVLQRSDDVGMLYELARMLVYRSYDGRHPDDVAEAVKWSGQAVNTHPDNARAYAINCLALSNANQDEDAVRACLRSLALNPSDADAHSFLSNAYYGVGRIPEGSQEADNALKLNTNSIDTNTEYALIAAYAHKYDLAIQYFKNATTINPNLEFPYFNLGREALTLGIIVDPSYFSVAVDSYNHILSLNPKNSKAYVRLCQTYMAEGQTNLAHDTCLTATNTDDNYIDAWAELGEVQYRAKQYDDAIKAFQTCVDKETLQKIGVKDRDTRCWYYQGLAQVLMQRCNLAVPIFTDLLSWTSETHAIDMSNKGLNLCISGKTG